MKYYLNRSFVRCRLKKVSRYRTCWGRQCGKNEGKRKNTGKIHLHTLKTSDTRVGSSLKPINFEPYTVLLLCTKHRKDVTNVKLIDWDNVLFFAGYLQINCLRLKRERTIARTSWVFCLFWRQFFEDNTEIISDKNDIRNNLPREILSFYSTEKELKGNIIV